MCLPMVSTDIMAGAKVSSRQKFVIVKLWNDNVVILWSHAVVVPSEGIDAGLNCRFIPMQDHYLCRN